MKLSVLMITFNHERYLRQALDSVLMQEVDFDYEIVVGEDCSTDGTRAILLEYAERHPDKFRLLLRQANLGPVRNFYSTLDACRGQYVALLEGDDYWTCTRKLKKQASFLDAHEDYVICFHNVIGHFEDGSEPDFSYVRGDLPETLGLEDLLTDNLIPTCSAVFRRGLNESFPPCVFELKMADYPLHLLNARHGKIRYLHESMGVYRVHPAGVWTSLAWDSRLASNIRLLELLGPEFPPKFGPAVRAARARRYWDLSAALEARGKTIEARRHAIRGLRISPFSTYPPFRRKLKRLMRLSTPGVYRMLRRLGHALTGSPVAAPIRARPACENPHVSIVIPAYNAERYLRQAIGSMLGQTFEVFECIVVDDGSTDRTAGILREIASADARVRPLRVPHGGIVAALNAGIHAARGEFIARMDADDVSLPHRLAAQVEFLNGHPECVAVGSRVMLMDPYGSPLWEVDVKTEHGQIEAELLRGNSWAMFHPATLIRKNAINAVGGYRPEVQWSEDIDLFLRLAEVGRLANLPEVLLHYRQHFSSVNRTKLRIQLERSRRVLTEAYQRRGLPVPVSFELELGPALDRPGQIRAWGRRALINRNFPVARRHALAAIRCTPLGLESWKLMYHALRANKRMPDSE